MHPEATGHHFEATILHHLLQAISSSDKCTGHLQILQGFTRRKFGHFEGKCLVASCGGKSQIAALA